MGWVPPGHAIEASLAFFLRHGRGSFGRGHDGPIVLRCTRLWRRALVGGVWWDLGDTLPTDARSVPVGSEFENSIDVGLVPTAGSVKCSRKGVARAPLPPLAVLRRGGAFVRKRRRVMLGPARNGRPSVADHATVAAAARACGRDLAAPVRIARDAIAPRRVAVLGEGARDARRGRHAAARVRIAGARDAARSEADAAVVGIRVAVRAAAQLVDAVGSAAGREARRVAGLGVRGRRVASTASSPTLTPPAMWVGVPPPFATPNTPAGGPPGAEK